MLMDILMEALMSMDEDTLDYVLESCDAEELEIIDSAMEMTIADRNDPAVKEYIRSRRADRAHLKEEYTNDPKIYNRLNEMQKKRAKMVTAKAIESHKKLEDRLNRIRGKS